MFIGADNVFNILSMYRLIWISGRFGGHKTALSYSIAERYLKQGYRLITNSRSIWADKLEDVDLDKNKHLKAVVLLDEGGLYFKNSRQVETIASYAAKMDCIYIIPSFWPPTKAAQIINIQPVVSLKATGLPVIIYKWRVDIGQTKERGLFFWIYPQEIYGVYSRQDPGDDPDSIIDFLVKKTEQFRKAFGRKTTNKLLNLEQISEGDKLLEASEIMASAVDDFTAVPKRRNKFR